MKIDHIDRDACRLLRRELQQSLEPLAEKFEVSVNIGSARFNPNSVTFKVEIATIGSDGQVNNREVGIFKRNAFLWGLQPSDLGREFVAMGETYKIVGANTRRHRFPISADRVRDGKPFKFGHETVKRGLK